MAAATMGWQGMGKPDFSQAAKLFYRLPAELRERCNRSEEKVLIWTLFLTWFSAVHSGRATALASFSETWLGGKIGRSRWTVGRALAQLEQWGLVKRIRRRPQKDGRFMTNMIAIGAQITSIICPKNRQVADKSPCSKTAPQEPESDYKRDKAAPLKDALLVPRQEEKTCLKGIKELFGQWLKEGQGLT